MLNFEFQNPTRIVFGKGTIARLADLVPAGARVLVLYGGESARKTGTLDEVRAALGSRAVAEYGGIEPNPTYETLMGAVRLIRADGHDYLLAVGGGSVLDGTKFVAAAARYAGEPWDFMIDHGETVTEALPFGAVLTLPATGSEMNPTAVISHKGKGDKLFFATPLVYPLFSILDPVKTYTLPPRQVANGIADAFVHIVEQYLTYPAEGRPQDRFAEGLLRTLVEIAPAAMAKSDDYDTRANLTWAATLALNGLIGSGVPQDWATHMIGHELTALYGIDHARTLAVVLPSLLAVRRDAKRAKLLQYAERVWDLTEGTEDARIDAAIARTRGFFESLGIGTRLSDYKVGREALDAVPPRLTAHGLEHLGERHDITPAVARAILEGAL